ncbi:B9 domain-containing protein 2-like [Culex quinquefasciatus]|uniref:B9 domain-containing protein 2-like n=1 Tax=Culex quinquefasciatus TaxID=7176 RepID=UPI0018E2B82B|nr:B9 domain-containing protein 2-like [Culex quinquefasciatus]XP_039433554.1 B9 domain-containing protein 2-like [Culex pipiens pallens]XP_039433587.1 B9 domain-containing protein 2-like [Culex pipiens pallens]
MPRRNLCPILGELCHASDFEEPNLFCKWSVQFGSSWKVIEGHCEGQSVANTARVDPRRSNFGTPLDLHLACRGIQVWPKLHVELIALNSFDNFWPVGYGFAFLPTQPGLHWIRMATWKVSSANSKSISDRFPAQNLPCHFPQFKN